MCNKNKCYQECSSTKDDYISLLCLARKIFARLRDDLIEFKMIISTLPNLIQSTDMQDDILRDLVLKRYDTALCFLYKASLEHLNTQRPSDLGIGTPVINSLMNENKSTDILGTQYCYAEKGGNRCESYLPPVTVGVYHHVSILKIYDVYQNHIGYKYKIGDLEFKLYNTTNWNLNTDDDATEENLIKIIKCQIDEAMKVVTKIQKQFQVNETCLNIYLESLCSSNSSTCNMNNFISNQPSCCKDKPCKKDKPACYTKKKQKSYSSSSNSITHM